MFSHHINMVSFQANDEDEADEDELDDESDLACSGAGDETDADRGLGFGGGNCQ